MVVSCLRSSANKVQNKCVSNVYLCVILFPLSETLRVRNSAWNFLGGKIFGQGIFFSFVESPRDFFGS